MNFDSKLYLKRLPALDGRAPVYIYTDVLGIATALGEYLERASAAKKTYYIALSGGTSPAAIFDELARTWKERINWSAFQIFWVDERFVPQDSKQSNYRMTSEHLLQKLPLTASQIHPVHTELPLDVAVAEYNGELQQLPQDKGLPCFDLILLGMGDDGHTASIFPGQDELWETESLCVPSRHPQSGQTRITLSGRVINNALQILVIANGAAKATMLKHVLDKHTELRLPITRIDTSRTDWLIDIEAATYI